MKQLVLKLDVNDEQVLNIAQGRIARISGNYKINMNKTTKLCTVTSDNIDPIEIVRKLRLLCRVDIVAVDTPKEPEKKKEEMVEEVDNASSRAAAVGPSKEPKKEDELRKEEPTKQEELVEEVVNASWLAAAVGPSKEPKKEDELRKEEPEKQEELVAQVVNASSLAAAVEPKKEDELRKEEPTKQEELVAQVVNASSLAAAVGPSKEPKKEDELRKEEPKKQEEKKEGEEIMTYVEVDRNITFGACQMKKAVLKLDLHDDKAKKKALMTVSGFPGVESVSIDMDKKLTVIGDIDPAHIAAKLRKLCHVQIITVGPAKEPEKKKDPADPVANLSYDPVANYLSYDPVADNQNACVIS